jgi:hypothetical protein
MMIPYLTSGIHDSVEERRVRGGCAIFSTVRDGNVKMAPLVSVVKLSEAIFSDALPIGGFDTPLSNRDGIMQKIIVRFGAKGVRTEPKADERIVGFELNGPTDVIRVWLAAKDFKIFFRDVEG